MFCLLSFTEIRRTTGTIKPNDPCICKKATIKLHETTSKSRLRDESSEFHGSWSGGLYNLTGGFRTADKIAGMRKKLTEIN
jgi:hypothetical protein